MRKWLRIYFRDWSKGRSGKIIDAKTVSGTGMRHVTSLILIRLQMFSLMLGDVLQDRKISG